MTDLQLPDPFTEIRIITLHALHGANYWSRHPVTRMDLNIGRYENISSADAPWFTGQLIAALPGLADHQCSLGHRGGLIERLRRGTYAAHIVEHVALELQNMVHYRVGYGRTRGTGNPCEYTVAFEHEHEDVGLRAAALALGVVQRAFAGALESVESDIAELRDIASVPYVPRVGRNVFCGITGSAGRTEARVALIDLTRGVTTQRAGDAAIVTISPAYLLQVGLPYEYSDFAVILDASPTDVPARYQTPERAARLVSVVGDAVRPGGAVICASNATPVQEIVRESGLRVYEFDESDDPLVRAQRAARCAADVMLSAPVGDVAG
jgi:cyanophycin synthetase